MNLSKIKQVNETKDIKEVNELLKNDWVLIDTYVNNGIIYILGRIKSEPQDIKFELNYGTDIEANKKRHAEMKGLKRQIIPRPKRMVSIGERIFVEIV